MDSTTNEQLAQVTLGGGCFWCLDATFQRIQGVKSVVSGYAGGKEPNPTYDQVSAHQTGHAEVVQITFDPHVVSLDELLEVFWTIHDPTTRNRQGNDVGPQYRSIILANSKEQRLAAEASIRSVAQPLWNDPVVTEVKLLEVFYPAEDYHQDYFNKNPGQAYCQAIINPKLAKLNQKFAHKLKDEYK